MNQFEPNFTKICRYMMCSAAQHVHPRILQLAVVLVVEWETCHVRSINGGG